MLTSNDWSPILRSIESNHPHLNHLRVRFSDSAHKGAERGETLPEFLRIAIAVAAQGCRSTGKPLRLAIIAPRWEKGALWTAVGAALCLLKSDFERANRQLPPFVVGQKLKLDQEKVVQFEGENDDGLRLRVDGGKGFLTVPHSYRLRLQPTNTKRPLSPVPWAGTAPPDLLDELLGIESQGARHIFSTRVALVGGVAASLAAARHCLASHKANDLSAPLKSGRRAEVLSALRRIKTRLFSQLDPVDSLCKLIWRAEELASSDEVAGESRQELAEIISRAIKLAKVRASSEIHGQVAQLEEILKLVQPARSSRAAPQVLLDLFQWGTLTPDGEAEIASSGQVDAPPVLLLSHDLLLLRTFLRGRPNDADKPLVVLDGASCFRNRLNDLKTVLDTGAPVIACIERGQQEDVKILAEQGFEVWKWLPDDLQCLSAETEKFAPLFGSLLRAHQNYARHQLLEQLCDGDAIEIASAALMELVSDCDPQQPETKELESALYRALLYVARLTHRSDDARRDAGQLIALARAAVLNRGLWLDGETRERAEAIIKAIESALQGDECGKSAGLRAVVAASNAAEIAVVVTPETVESSRNEWELWCRDEPNLAEKKVSFCCHSTVEAHLRATSTSHLIICGWLGAHRMRGLLDGCLSADISLLLYPFERGWLRGALRRWRGVDRGTGANLSVARRLALLGLERADLKLTLSEKGREPLADLMDSLPACEERASEFDAGEYEARLRVHRRARYSVARPGEETEPARLIEFAGGGFAFLAESCRLPIVSELVAIARGEISVPKNSGRKSELPQKRADKLAVGDYVVFRSGSAGDLIRDMADIVLRRAGAGAMRERAGVWKSALRAWVEAESKRALGQGIWDAMPTIMEQLRATGIERGAPTVRYWLDEESNTIGPQAPETVLPAIARLTGNAELQNQLPAVLDAIARVRSAHFSASDELKRALHGRLPAYLAQQSGDSFLSGALEVEIEGVGHAVVVRVEEIAAEVIAVARGQLNFYQTEA